VLQVVLHSSLLLSLQQSKKKNLQVFSGHIHYYTTKMCEGVEVYLHSALILDEIEVTGQLYAPSA
jgi:hypothetical protein